MCLTFAGRLLASTVLVFAFVADGQDADTDGETPLEDDAAPVAEEAADDVETIVVTGSRLPKGDPTAFVYSLTAPDAEALRMSSVEDLMRTLPQTYHSINQQTSPVDSSALAPSEAD